MAEAEKKQVAYTGNLYHKETPKNSGVWTPLDVRILATSDGKTGWLQTRTHEHWHGEDGKKRPFTYECPKANHHPNYAANIHCDACADYAARFSASGGVRAQFWVWAIDLADGNRLKSLAIPYSVYSEILTITSDPQTMSYAEGGQLVNVPLRIARTGKGLSTSYTVSPLRPEPFDLVSVLTEQGHTSIPPLIAEFKPATYPPITKLTEEQLEGLAQGKLPWANGEGGGSYAATEYKAVGLADLVGGGAPVAPAAPVMTQQQAAPVQATYSAPVLEAVQTDVLPGTSAAAGIMHQAAATAQTVEQPAPYDYTSAAANQAPAVEEKKLDIASTEEYF